MNFLRPEAKAWLWRWREVAAAIFVTLYGASWVFRGFGITPYIGGVTVVVGLFLLLGAVQRQRFARGGGGAGVVVIDERRVSYLGPLTGGIIDLDDLARLALDGLGKPAHWQLTSADGTTLSIPIDAEGADALFDAFSALPALRTERVLAALDAPAKAVVPLWSRAPSNAPRLPAR